MNKHPDQLVTQDVGPLESFTFTTAAIAHAVKETETLIARYEAQLDEIIQSHQVGGYPLIDNILKLTHDREELKGLAAGLAKAANLAASLDQLKIRKQTLDLAKSDPAFFGWAFGDFSDEADQLEQHFETLLKEESTP